MLTEEAFHDAIDAHGPAVFRFAMANVGPDHAEDVMAETFAAAWKSRAQFVDSMDNAVEAWLIGIARNVIRSHWRSERRWFRARADELRHLAEGSRPHDDLDAAERIDARTLFERARVLERLAKLPDRERDPFLLHVLHDYSYQEIAAILGIPLGTVQSRISRGRSRLARSIRATRREQP